ncbi:MAG: GtrA family protein [Candidatus Thermoplasmatota archaeon]|nr:GtrA family protein [Candidatus Thermoplasmatota archaeon]MCL5786334.1 GtrA family protein [Candidatus Thermoplasmatota archaeon]
MPLLSLQIYPDADSDLGFIEDMVESGIDLEFIVIDDPGSIQTGALEQLRQRYGDRIIRVNGKGNFLSNFSSSLEMCRGEFVTIIRSGVDFEPSALHSMMRKAEEGYDIVIASRFSTSEGEHKHTDLRTKLIHLIVREMSAVRDPLSGIFLVRRDKIGNVAMSTGVDTILPELLLKTPGLKIAEVPARTEVNHRVRFSFRQFLAYCSNLLKLSKYRAVKYAIVGASGVAVNEGVLYAMHGLLKLQFATATFLLLPVATVIAIQASIVSNFILNNGWTFKDRKGGGVLSKFLKFELFAWTGASVNLATVLIASPYIFYLLADLIGIGLGYIINYLSSDILVWRIKKAGSDTID